MNISQRNARTDVLRGMKKTEQRTRKNVSAMKLNVDCVEECDGFQADILKIFSEIAS